MKDENRDNKLRPLTEALEDHSAEGIALLSAEPRKLTMLAVVTTGVLVLCALLWSFFGHADVIVTAQGTLAPESEVRRFYAPVDGELVDLYVAEGQPVSKDDVVARLNARGAIEAAANALQAQLKVEDAERDWKLFRERKALLERRALALKQQIELNSRQHENRLAEGTTRLAEQQRAQLTEARSNLENARRAREFARQEQDRYARLAQEFTQASAQLEGSGQELASLRVQYDAAVREITSTEDKLRLQVQTARLVADAAARIRFENIDKDNFLLILAPVSGVITDVTSTQRGDKVQANTPLGGIAPKDARPMLRIEIAERDRAFLREGLPVKLKFSAFPYQRYGLIAGTLEYISPATKPSGPDKQPVYEGRVRLAQDYYSVASNKYPLRYGMTATAEIVVRERRLIDLGLDPFRQVAG